MEGKRQRGKPIPQLEDDFEKISDCFTGLIMKSHSGLALEDLKTSSRELKYHFDLLSDAMVQLCLKYQAVGSVSQNDSIAEKRLTYRSQYRTKINAIRELRQELGDDDLSTAPQSRVTSENLACLSEIPPTEKMDRFLKESRHSLPQAEPNPNEATPAPLLSSANPEGSVAEESIPPASAYEYRPPALRAEVPPEPCGARSKRSSLITFSENVTPFYPATEAYPLPQEPRRPEPILRQPTPTQEAARNSVPTLAHPTFLNQSLQGPPLSSATFPAVDPYLVPSYEARTHQSMAGMHNNASLCMPLQQPPNPFRCPPPEASQQTSSSAPNYLMRRELMRPDPSPYSGEPSKFASWAMRMKRKLQVPNLSPLEIIDVLNHSTKGGAQKIVQDYVDSAPSNPDLALEEIWRELYRTYGTPAKVSADLTLKIRSLTPVKGDDITRLKEVLRMCRSVMLNQSTVKDLEVFNSSSGMSCILRVLPNKFYDRWRHEVYSMSKNGLAPNFASLTNFLGNYIQELAIIEPAFEPKRVPLTTLYTNPQHEPQVNDPPPTLGDPDKHYDCPLHKDNTHTLNKCDTYHNLSVADRASFVQQARLCFNCLGRHLKKHCKSKFKCRRCGCNHHTSLHKDPTNVPTRGPPAHSPGLQPVYRGRGPSSSSSSAPTGGDSSGGPNDACSQNRTTHTTLVGSIGGANQVRSTSSKVLLADVSANQSGKSVRCYVILDDQSSTSFIAPELVEKLGVSGPQTDYTLRTMSGLSTSTSGSVIRNLRIRGAGLAETLDLPPLLSSPHIPNCINEVASPTSVKNHPLVRKYYKSFNEVDRNSSVLMLLGRDSGNLIGCKSLNSTSPFVYVTKLGYAIVGLPQCHSEACHNVFRTSLATPEHFDADLSLPKYRVTGSLPPLEESLDDSQSDDELPGYSQDDSKFVKLMLKETRLNDKGFLQMPLPIRDRSIMLPKNKSAVFCRTRNTLERLKRDSQKLTDCLATMGDYIEAGHVEVVPEEEIEVKPGKAWWLPVFPVTHAKKLKTRIVFDSSAEYEGWSLNKALLQGPNENNNLKGVLLRFRDGPIGVCADIKTMFHNFFLPKEDRDYIRFFWFRDNNPDNQLVEMRAAVHIFGNSPSPAVANFGLKSASLLATPPVSSETKSVIDKSFYVDDALIACDSSEKAIKVLSESKDALKEFNILLHKIASNCSEVVESYPISDRRGETELSLGESPSCSTLGLRWKLKEDLLSFSFKIPDRPFTKRGIISVINSLFDPLGIAAPVILEGRILQRKILSGSPDVPWDEPLPNDHQNSWNRWLESLEKVNELSIPRSFYPKSMVPLVKPSELHIFADASSEAIGYSIYIKTFGSNGSNVSFVCAGSKVAPRLGTSIPRLELCAAVEASKAAAEVRRELHIGRDECYYYSDSQVSLGYLRNHSRRFSRYVQRRVEIIHSTTGQAPWLYVSSSSNPADISSRPHTPDALINSRWLCGPSFLSSDSYSEPQIPGGNLDASELPEYVEEVVALASARDDDPISNLIDRCRSWALLIGTVSRVLSLLRVVDQFKQRRGESLAPRPPGNAEWAIRVIITHEQHRHKTLNTSTDNLSPFTDTSGLTRVGGRLAQSSLSFESKHPVIIPQKSPITRLIVSHYHAEVYHQGRVITLARIRYAGFFITGLRGLISSFIHKCPTCIKLRRQPNNPKMSDLPASRLQEVAAFSYVGLDAFGPFHVTNGRCTRRNSGSKKLWAVIFLCQCSRAVHVETIPSMDTTAFQNALRRFMAVRGTPIQIRSDNGSNFIAVRSQLESANLLGAVRKAAESKGIEWVLNPPRASSFGGTWERAIGSIRKILNATLIHTGKRVLNADELQTLLQEACAIINSTPLWETSDFPDDPLPLSPAHLLTLKGHPNSYHPESFDRKDIDSYGRYRWKRVQYLADIFWQKWRDHYLHTLMSREKWWKSRPEPVCGSVVLIKDKNTRRNQWEMARVISTIPSEDGISRSCLVKSSRGTFRRATSSLVPVTTSI